MFIETAPRNATVVAQALLSRGAMTAPRSVFVAVREDGEGFIVAVWNHQTGSYFDTDYPAALCWAYEIFAERVAKDARSYLEKGVPLTVRGEG